MIHVIAAVIVYGLWWDKPLALRVLKSLPIKDPLTGSRHEAQTQSRTHSHALALTVKISRSLGGTFVNLKLEVELVFAEENRSLIGEEEIWLPADNNKTHIKPKFEVPKALPKNERQPEPPGLLLFGDQFLVRYFERHNVPPQRSPEELMIDWMHLATTDPPTLSVRGPMLVGRADQRWRLCFVCAHYHTTQLFLCWFHAVV
ncbi:hypothetical protein BDD12DRAFT_808578 [Trichophaea hybrida]|nr:hypothetical protein BDD12DRAFT_808578 [Trichophaea hybrida]